MKVVSSTVVDAEEKPVLAHCGPRLGVGLPRLVEARGARLVANAHARRAGGGLQQSRQGPVELPGALATTEDQDVEHVVVAATCRLLEEGVTHRHARQLARAAELVCRSQVCQCGKAGETREPTVGETGAGVRLEQHDGQAGEPSAEHSGRGDEATGTDDRRRRLATHDVPCLGRGDQSA